MFFDVIKQRIDLYNELSNSFNLNEDFEYRQKIQTDMKTLIIVILLLILFYLIIFILSFYYILAFYLSLSSKYLNT